jgi:hypothetical protein
VKSFIRDCPYRLDPIDFTTQPSLVRQISVWISFHKYKYTKPSPVTRFGMFPPSMIIQTEPNEAASLVVLSLFVVLMVR